MQLNIEEDPTVPVTWQVMAARRTAGSGNTVESLVSGATQGDSSSHLKHVVSSTVESTNGKE
jgi:hypothetical protein